jgi:hypothetical protein
MVHHTQSQHPPHSILYCGISHLSCYTHPHPSHVVTLKKKHLMHVRVLSRRVWWWLSPDFLFASDYVRQLGRAMVQAVSRRPLTADAQVRARVSQCGICGEPSVTGTDFSTSSLVFLCQYHSTVALRTHVSSRRWTIGRWWPQFRDSLTTSTWTTCQATEIIEDHCFEHFKAAIPQRRQRFPPLNPEKGGRTFLQKSICTELHMWSV